MRLLPSLLTLELQILAGKHLRHARDHFALLIDCISSHPPYVLNYDTRSRNTPMESSRQAAHDALKDAIAQLETIVPHSHFDAPLTLNAVTPYPQTMQSTFGREVSAKKSRSGTRTDTYLQCSYGLGRCTLSTTGLWQVSLLLLSGRRLTSDIGSRHRWGNGRSTPRSARLNLC